MNSNIKAVVLDVDGILVGFKNGVNFPMPCLEIVNALKAIKESGIPVILCTGRPFYTPAMKYVIEAAGLDNFHIGEMGCLITNPFSEDVLQCKTIEQSDCRRLARRLLENNIVTYFSTAEKYYVQKNQADNGINKLLSASIETLPQVVDSLEESIKDSQVLYMSGSSKNKSAETAMAEIITEFNGRIELLWGNNLFLTDHYYGFFVPSGVSKVASLSKLIKHLGISFESVLGAGDGVVDWEFMKLCGYRATLENALPKVKQNIATAIANDPHRNFLGPHIDQSGILEVFKHFGLF